MASQALNEEQLDAEGNAECKAGDVWMVSGWFTLLMVRARWLGLLETDAAED
jgi:hypothetical protein